MQKEIAEFLGHDDTQKAISKNISCRTNKKNKMCDKEKMLQYFDFTENQKDMVLFLYANKLFNEKFYKKKI